MYKAMIVDDEPIILKGLSRIINWEEYGVEIAASARDGSEALELLDRQHADILITDIKMYGMDGLELIQNIRDRGLAVKIIILSGYDDFAYVKKAARLGIENYLLKPIEEDELSATLQNITEKLDRERKAEFRQRKDNGILRENILFRWLTGNISENELINRAEFLGIGLDEKYYQIGLVHIVGRRTSDSEGGADYLPCGVQNICAELLADYCHTLAFNSMTGDTILIFSGDADQVAGQRTVSLLQTVIDRISVCLHIDLIATVGPAEPGYMSAPGSYQKAAELLEYQIVFPANTIITYDNIARACEKADYTTKIDYRSLKDAVLAQDIEAAQQSIDAIYAKIRRSQYISPDFIRSFVIGILYNIFGSLNIRQMPGGRSDFHSRDLYQVLSRYTLPDIFSWLKGLVAAYIRQTQADEDKCSPVIRSVLKYIDCNYMKELSLKTLSDLYHMNAAYLGQLFKRETGELFSGYLNRLRIEKAKEMLSRTNMRESDIVSRVGYANISYFSNIFKKMVGVYPSEYKKTVNRLD